MNILNRLYGPDASSKWQASLLLGLYGLAKPYLELLNMTDEQFYGLGAVALAIITGQSIVDIGKGAAEVKASAPPPAPKP